MQAVEFYSSGGSMGRPVADFKQPPNPDSAYKSLGSVFGHKDPNSSPPPPRETKKKLACSSSSAAVAPTVNNNNSNSNGLLLHSANSSRTNINNNSSVVVKAARSVQNVSAERSYSVSEQHRGHAVHRTPHRTAGYGGAGQPSRGPHRFGHPDMRASYSERLSSRNKNNYRGLGPGPSGEVYKSNSSLDLDHEIDILQESCVGGRREYGSHGSLEVMGREQQLLAMFPPPPSLLGDGPAAVSTLTRPVHFNHQLNRSEESNGSVVSNGSAVDMSELDGGAGLGPGATSPKQKKRPTIGFWSNSKDKAGTGSNSSRKSQKGLFKKRTGKEGEGGVKAAADTEPLDNKAEDKHRRRFFSHYDIGSVGASLSVTARQRTLQRRNTTTGASAASAALRNSGVESPEGEEGDQGDGVSNELVLSCPYFRNEIGGEEERLIALTRETGRTWGGVAEDSAASDQPRLPCHTPRQARGFCLLEQASTHWKNGICPYGSGRNSPVLEKSEAGSTYYKTYFYGKEHQDWFGVDENLGPLAISIRRERVPHTTEEGRVLPHPLGVEHYMYRLIVRTSELLPLRGTVLEDSIPALKSEKLKTIPTKEVLEFCFPELQLSSLHLGVQSGPCEEQLVKLDEQCSEKTYKVGVMYCRAGQQTEEEMYNNEEGGPAFNEFLDIIGQRVRLKGFNKYKAGLCNKNDSTGLYSVYTEFEGNEIMFHVSTLLPFTPNNRQQLPRKRYIGNDIVTVVFQEPGALPFIPNIRSQFQHVFIIVRAHSPCSDNTHYSIAVTRSKNVPIFGPPIPAGALFPKSAAFTRFLLTKIVNAENAAHRSDKFVSMATRTRQEYLKDLATNYVTPTTLDSGSKFAIFAPKKKLSVRPRFSPDASLKGALSWAVVVEDCSTNSQLEAYIAISSDTLVIIQDNTHKDILFLTPCKSILGWSATHNSIRIFYHQGECVIVHSKDWEADDMAEISARLKSVTPGAACQEFALRRNQLGQLGFHVQHDGLITEVENFGYAWQTGLRQGSRLVEICRHPVTTLTHEQMVDLLKTSRTVAVTVIPPHPDGSPRQGCHLAPGCSYAFGGFEGDYENVNGEGEKVVVGGASGAAAGVGAVQAPSTGKMRYERSLSPPRSSSSSGYGTGSSSKSFVEGTISNTARYPGGATDVAGKSSSGGGEERWYDFMEQGTPDNSSPPPLPTRIGSKASAFIKVQQGGVSRESPSSNSSIPEYINSSTVFPGAGHYAASAASNMQQQASRNSNTYSGYESGGSETLKSSSSTPHQLSAAGYSPPSGGSGIDYPEERRSVEARSTYLTDFELARQQPLPQLQQHVINNHISVGNHHNSSRGSLDRDITSSADKDYISIQNNNILLQHERLAAIRLTAADNTNTPPSVSSSLDDRIVGSAGCSVRSEDELSAAGSSTSQSPLRSRGGGGRRNTTTLGGGGGGGGATTPSSSSAGSRTQSPRTVTSTVLETGAAKKKAAARSARNSANLTASTLQEDLMRLIGPDSEQDSEPLVMQAGGHQDSPLSRLPRKTLSELSLMKSRSRENIAGSGVDMAGEELSNNSSYHMARPATVISGSSLASSASSPAAGELLRGSSPHVSSVSIGAAAPAVRSGRTSGGPSATSPVVVVAGGNIASSSTMGGRYNKEPVPPNGSIFLPLPATVDADPAATIVGPKNANSNKSEAGNSQDMDWSSLVDTATKAIIMSAGEDGVGETDPQAESSVQQRRPRSVVVGSCGADEEEELRRLLQRVNSLEAELAGERRGREQLGRQVEQLRQENVRLQEESQTAAQQLRRFTEWFFQTIDKS